MHPPSEAQVGYRGQRALSPASVNTNSIILASRFPGKLLCSEVMAWYQLGDG